MINPELIRDVVALALYAVAVGVFLGWLAVGYRRRGDWLG